MTRWASTSHSSIFIFSYQSHLFTFFPLDRYLFVVSARSVLLPSLQLISHPLSSILLHPHIVCSRSKFYTTFSISISISIRAWKVYALREQSLHRTADVFLKVVQDLLVCLRRYNSFLKLCIMYHLSLIATHYMTRSHYNYSISWLHSVSRHIATSFKTKCTVSSNCIIRYSHLQRKMAYRASTAFQWLVYWSWQRRGIRHRWSLKGVFMVQWFISSSSRLNCWCHFYRTDCISQVIACNSHKQLSIPSLWTLKLQSHLILSHYCNTLRLLFALTA